MRGAYALRERAGAESFADAWEMAVIVGIDATRDCVIDRAMHGGWVPVVRRGRIVRMEFRSYDRLALGILSGRGQDIEQNRAEQARIRAYRREIAEEDRGRKEVAEAHRKVEEEILHEWREKSRPPRSAPAKIRSL